MPKRVIFLFALMGICAIASAKTEVEGVMEIPRPHRLPSGFEILEVPSSEELQSEFEKLSPEAQQWFLRNRRTLLQKTDKVLGKIVSPERTRKALEAVDQNLWEKAGLISNANELGVSLEGGIDGGAMVNRWGLYGITGLGVIAAVDPGRRGVSFELYQDLDRTRRALPFHVGVGVFGSLILSASHYQWDRPLRVEKGTGFCSFGMAGCMTDSNLRLATSWGMGAAFPPVSVLTSTIYRVPYARIGFFPKWPYVRIRILGEGALRTAVAKPVAAIKKGARACAAWMASLGEK